MYATLTVAAATVYKKKMLLLMDFDAVGIRN
jgi:hypothetical protein